MVINWNTAFKDNPADNSKIAQVAQQIRTLRLAIEERIAGEHAFPLATGTSNDQGRHVQGSGRCYVAADFTGTDPVSAPENPRSASNTTLPPVSDTDLDTGRMVYRVTSKTLEVHDGTVFQKLSYLLANVAATISVAWTITGAWLINALWTFGTRPRITDAVASTNNDDVLKSSEISTRIQTFIRDSVYPIGCTYIQVANAPSPITLQLGGAGVTWSQYGGAGWTQDNGYAIVGDFLRIGAAPGGHDGPHFPDHTHRHAHGITPQYTPGFGAEGFHYHSGNEPRGGTTDTDATGVRDIHSSITVDNSLRPVSTNIVLWRRTA